MDINCQRRNSIKFAKFSKLICLDFHIIYAIHFNMDMKRAPIKLLFQPQNMISNIVQLYLIKRKTVTVDSSTKISSLMQFKEFNGNRTNRYKQVTTTKHSDGKIVPNLTKDHPEVKI